jgi:hypothetical protein
MQPLQVLHEPAIGPNLLPNPNNITKRLLQRHVLLNHKIGNNKSSTSRDSHMTMNQNVFLLELILDELCGRFEMFVEA